MDNGDNWLRRHGKWVGLGVALIAVGAALIFVFAHQRNSAPPAPEPAPDPLPVIVPEVSQPEPQPEPEYPHIDYPEGELAVTSLRQSYRSGEMWLRIPRVDYFGPVLDAVDEESLTKGIGLYDYAQMPSWGNPNTSIAGHRDIYGAEFYYLDTVQAGDLLYLYWQEDLYTYEYLDTIVVDEDNWDVIRIADRPIVTLTTCTPLGTSDFRMIVTGELVSIRPLSEEELAEFTDMDHTQE